MAFSQSTAVVGLGSNLGDREAHLRAAVDALCEILQGVRTSPIYESPALLPENAPKKWNTPYLNMAATGSCALEPLALLATLKEIEKKLGRTESGRWGPRVLDLDLLTYGNRTMATEQLTLPHAELLSRDFALQPLVDLWPQWQHPNGTVGGHALVKLPSALKMLPTKRFMNDERCKVALLRQKWAEFAGRSYGEDEYFSQGLAYTRLFPDEKETAWALVDYLQASGASTATLYPAPESYVAGSMWFIFISRLELSRISVTLNRPLDMVTANGKGDYLSKYTLPWYSLRRWS